MEYTFKRKKLSGYSSIRLFEEQEQYIREVAKKNNVKVADVIRTFLQVGIDQFKNRSTKR